MPEDDHEAETRAVDRLTLFSDAVVAIAITLLAIDLPLPEGDSAAQFCRPAAGEPGAPRAPPEPR